MSDCRRTSARQTGRAWHGSGDFVQMEQRSDKPAATCPCELRRCVCFSVMCSLPSSALRQRRGGHKNWKTERRRLSTTRCSGHGSSERAISTRDYGWYFDGNRTGSGAPSRLGERQSRGDLQEVASVGVSQEDRRLTRRAGATARRQGSRFHVAARPTSCSWAPSRLDTSQPRRERICWRLAERIVG